VRNLLDWLGGHVNLVLVAVLLVIAGTWVFIALADEVLEGDTKHFDEYVLRTLRNPETPERPIGPKWLTEVARDVTALGGVTVLTFMTVAVTGYLLIVRKYHAMWFVLAAALGALLISTGLKNFFSRPRPELVPHLATVYTSSFPSGHSMLSSSIYLTLGALLARLLPGRRDKIYFIGVAMIVTFLVGCSRVYLGVHYPTDVLAGWTAGLVWALLCWLTARSLQRSGAVEKDTEQTAPAQATTTTKKVHS
jgi:undecaprenyl-diphosphatase